MKIFIDAFMIIWNLLKDIIMEINVVPEKKYMSFECTNSINGIDVHFVSHIQIRNKKDVTNLYNYLFYVDATFYSFLRLMGRWNEK